MSWRDRLWAGAAQSSQLVGRWAGPHQALQDPLYGFEYLRSRGLHVLGVVQAGDSEGEAEGHQVRAATCSGRDGEEWLILGWRGEGPVVLVVPQSPELFHLEKLKLHVS